MEIREIMTCVFIFDLRGSGFTQSEITPEFHNSSRAVLGQTDTDTFDYLAIKLTDEAGKYYSICWWLY